MKLLWRSELPQLLVIALMFAAAAWAWPLAPEQMPVHWDLHGQVDRWGGKFEGLLGLPLVTVGLYLLLLLLPVFDPGRSNYPSFANAFLAIRSALVAFFAALHGVVVLYALGQPVDMNTVVLLLMGVLFIVLGNYLGKIRPNWFVGVRTPWTLSSKLSWDKTHRLAGWLFVLMGVMFVVAAIFQEAWAFTAMFVINGLCLVWIVAYSYLIYRRDPNRTQPAGTSPEME